MPVAFAAFPDGAIVASGAVALVALALAGLALVRLRRLRADQKVILTGPAEDLVGHVAALHRAFEALHGRVEQAETQLMGRMELAEHRLDGAIAYRALVRYDAYEDVAGNQSHSLALLDAEHNGVVISSLIHRDTARLYCKRVLAGEGEHALSPEESEAVRRALAGEVGTVTLDRAS